MKQGIRRFASRYLHCEQSPIAIIKKVPRNHPASRKIGANRPGYCQRVRFLLPIMKNPPCVDVLRISDQARAPSEAFEFRGASLDEKPQLHFGLSLIRERSYLGISLGSKLLTLNTSAVTSRSLVPHLRCADAGFPFLLLGFLLSEMQQLRRREKERERERERERKRERKRDEDRPHADIS